MREDHGKRGRFAVLALMWAMAAALVSALAPAPVSAHGCAACHAKSNVVVEIPDHAPMFIIADGRKTSVDLGDVFAFHGHECPGAAIAFLAVKHGLDILYGPEVPRREDLLVACGIPARGTMDVIDLVMKGDDPSGRTWPPAGMALSPDGFFFRIYSKSTLRAVDVRLKPEFFPRDFFKLKKKNKNKTMTPQEWDTLHGYMKTIIMEYPAKPLDELFGRPEPYRVVWWGTVRPGEMDRNIRELRRAQRKAEQ